MNRHNSRGIATENGTGTAELQSWKSAACPFVIEYSSQLMDQLRRRSVENFHALPYGGLEVGGILFGRVTPNGRAALRVEIAAERPLEGEHASGPAFVLSEAETAQIPNIIENRRLDPELAPLSVVGFWVSHGRSALALTGGDLDLYQKFFPNPWQVVLVLKPEASRPPLATFFFRAGGRIAEHRPEDEFSTALSATQDSAAADQVPEMVPETPVAARTPLRFWTRRNAVGAAALAGVFLDWASDSHFAVSRRERSQSLAVRSSAWSLFPSRRVFYWCIGTRTRRRSSMRARRNY